MGKPKKKTKMKAAKKMPIAKKMVKAKKVKAAPVPVKIEVKRPPYIHKKGPHIAFLGLGSNVGDREEFIEQAIFLLNKNKNISVMKHSSNHETEAEGPPAGEAGAADQPPFINAVVQIKTTLSPTVLLKTLNEIENSLGRDRETEWGPRTIDIDILMYDDIILSEDDLQIPHPLMHERIFVLKPLKEIAPLLVHPILEKTIADLFEEKKAEAGDKYDDELPGFKDIKQANTDDFERW